MPHLKIAVLTNLSLLPKSFPVRLAELSRRLEQANIEVKLYYKNVEWFRRSHEPLKGFDAVLLRPNDGLNLGTADVAVANRPFFAATLSTGSDHIEQLSALEHEGVHIVRASSGNANAVAKWALHQASELRRNLAHQAARVASGIWDQSHKVRANDIGFFPSLLDGTTWVTIGAGQQVERLLPLLRAQDVARVIIWNHRFESEERFAACLRSMSSREAVSRPAFQPEDLALDRSEGAEGRLANVYRSWVGSGDRMEVIGTDGRLVDAVQYGDVVSVHVPLAATTRGLVDREVISRLKDAACLLIASRAGIVDEEALVEAYDRNKLLGIAADVVDNEQTRDRSRSALWGRAFQARERNEPVNILVTPHVGGQVLPDVQVVYDDVLRKLEAEIHEAYDRRSPVAQSARPIENLKEGVTGNEHPGI